MSEKKLMNDDMNKVEENGTYNGPIMEEILF